MINKNIYNFNKNNKAQIGDTLTWVVAFMLIIAIVVLFSIGANMIYSGKKTTFIEGKYTINNFADIQTSKAILDFFNANKEIIFNWSDDGYAFNPGVNPAEPLTLEQVTKKNEVLCEKLKEHYANSEIAEMCIENDVGGKIEIIRIRGDGKECDTPFSQEGAHCISFFDQTQNYYYVYVPTEKSIVRFFILTKWRKNVS